MTYQQHSVRLSFRPAMPAYERHVLNTMAEHASLLSRHRRSVLVYYVVVGLVLGMMIGLAAITAAEATNSQECASARVQLDPAVVTSIGRRNGQS